MAGKAYTDLRPVAAMAQLAPDGPSSNVSMIMRGAAMSHELPDRWIARLNEGDVDAVEPVFLAYEPYLRIAIRRRLSPRLRPKVDSGDVVQSVFADLVRGVRDGGWHFAGRRSSRLSFASSPGDASPIAIKNTGEPWTGSIRWTTPPRSHLPTWLRAVPARRPRAANAGKASFVLARRLTTKSSG